VYFVFSVVKDFLQKNPVNNVTGFYNGLAVFVYFKASFAAAMTSS